MSEKHECFCGAEQWQRAARAVHDAPLPEGYSTRSHYDPETRMFLIYLYHEESTGPGPMDVALYGLGVRLNDRNLRDPEFDAAHEARAALDWLKDVAEYGGLPGLQPEGPSRYVSLDYTLNHPPADAAAREMGGRP